MLSGKPPGRARASQSELYAESNESMCDIGFHDFPESRDIPFFKARVDSSTPREISAEKSEVDSILLQVERDSRIEWR